MAFKVHARGCPSLVPFLLLSPCSSMSCSGSSVRCRWWSSKQGLLCPAVSMSWSSRPPAFAQTQPAASRALSFAFGEGDVLRRDCITASHVCAVPALFPHVSSVTLRRHECPAQEPWRIPKHKILRSLKRAQHPPTVIPSGRRVRAKFPFFLSWQRCMHHSAQMDADEFYVLMQQSSD